MSNGSERIPEYETHCPTCDAPEPTHTPTCAVPGRDNFDSLRSRIAALEAVIAAARSAAQPTQNGEPLRERIIAVLDLAPSVRDTSIRRRHPMTTETDPLLEAVEALRTETR